MKIKETRKIPEKEISIVVATVCDLCNQKYHGENWGRNLYVREDTNISYESGTVYPEGGTTETVIYDICPKCFKNKLMPWLESQGAAYRTEERDW